MQHFGAIIFVRFASDVISLDAMQNELFTQVLCVIHCGAEHNGLACSCFLLPFPNNSLVNDLAVHNRGDLFHIVFFAALGYVVQFVTYA